MADPFVGEVKFFGFPFAPKYWGLCNGASIGIRQQTNLFALLGTQFGGDGVTTFQLPNLASRMLVGSGQGAGLSNRVIGGTFGETSVTLQLGDLPPHVHTFQAFNSTDTEKTNQPSAASAVSLCSETCYTNSPPNAQFNTAAVSPTGGGQPHANVQPVLGLTPAIAMMGTWPQWD